MCNQGVPVLRCKTALLLLVGVLALSACGDDGDADGATAAGSSSATLKVGVLPIAESAPLYLGIAQGFFKEEQLTVEPQIAQGGAAIIPSVVSGDFQIGVANTASFIIASAKGLPLTALAPADAGGTGADDAIGAVLVRDGSAIKDAADLAGKTIAVNTLNNIGPLTINAALDKRGVDYEGVKYVELPFPDMLAAVQTKRVDAAWVVEPFFTQGKDAGHRIVLHPYEETAQNLTIAEYFTTKQYAAEHADVVQRFTRAMKKSLQYATDNPDAVREILLSYTKTPKAVAEKIALPAFPPEFNEASIQQQIELAVKFGFIEKKVELAELLAKGGS
jgi:NitT/TauT family transport system substrate-binding protein